MSAQVTLQRQADGLDVLRELVELVRNPDVITKSAEITREQLALTAEEESKVNEARKLLAEYDALSKELDEGREALKRDRVLLSDESDSFDAQRSAEENRLKNLATVLANKESVLDKKERDLLAKEKLLADDRAALSADHKELLELAEAEGAKNAATAQANREEFARLKDYEEALKAKAAKLRESAADI